MMHGGLDNGGGLISFHRVSGFFFSTFNCTKSQCLGSEFAGIPFSACHVYHNIPRYSISPDFLDAVFFHRRSTFWILKIQILRYCILLLWSSLHLCFACVWKKPPEDRTSPNCTYTAILSWVVVPDSDKLLVLHAVLYPFSWSRFGKLLHYW